MSRKRLIFFVHYVLKQLSWIEKMVDPVERDVCHELSMMRLVLEAMID